MKGSEATMARGSFDWFWKAMGTSPTKNQKKSRSTVARANECAASFGGSGLNAASDAEVVQLARDAIRDGANPAIDNMPALLAAVREAASRTLSLTPFDVQLQGTYRLLSGDVVEMVTGEGKTLAGAMAAVGYALQGKRVHIITVNSYLARRDDSWMGPLFEFFGLSHGAIAEGQLAADKREVYAHQIVFGAINELGFDVLRDQLVTRAGDVVRTPADVAIIDEADSVMVDEALVPLVLAGSAPGPAPTAEVTELVRTMEENEHFTISSDQRNVFLTEAGAAYAERRLGVASLYDGAADSDSGESGYVLTQINVALHAAHLLTRDIHYIVRDGKVALIDGSRGRVAELQRWPDGLQAAVEAKEGLKVTDGGRILDQITVQTLVGMYPEACGMTGTALAASDQLRQFYGLQVSVIEPNRPQQRFDEQDRVFATVGERNAALIQHIVEVHGTGQPILIGTQDVAESELIADKLADYDVPCQVLNAKNHEAEAQIVADAGRLGHVTVSTQMAGRGTDIKLGGPEENERDAVVELGGLHVIGVGRFRSQRLDNQLRGRAGRQGDPGSSVMFVSLEDDVVTVGGAGEELQARPEPDGYLPQKKVLQFVDHCQRVSEGQMLDIHATTWKYNKLVSDQRAIINERRQALLQTAAAWDELSEALPERAAELEQQGIEASALEQGAREIMLYHLDLQWSEHLAYLDEIRESIHLRAIARESPIDEFHRMSIAAFKDLAQRAVTDARATFAEVPFDADGAQLEDLGLQKPSATWTYMVNDNPLSSGGGSVVGSIVNMFR